MWYPAHPGQATADIGARRSGLIWIAESGRVSVQKEGVVDDIDARSLLTFHKLGEVGSVPFRTIPFPVGASPDFCFQREPN